MPTPPQSENIVGSQQSSDISFSRLPVGATAHTVAAGDDTRITGAEQVANKGASGGYTPLDSGVLVPNSYLQAIFDANSPASSAPGDAATVGSATTAAKRDHKHGREAFATPSIALSTAAAAGAAGTLVRSDATIAAFDATSPTSSAMGDAAAVGAAGVAARRDHKHGRESFATPAVVLGTAAAAGSAATPIRSDSTIVAFDATVPVTQALGDTAATGTATVAARRDHKHGMPGATSVTHKFRVRRATAQNTSFGSFTKILFDTADFDTSSDFDIVTNNRFNVPVTGYYQFNAYCSAGGTPGSMIIALFHNGAFVYQRGGRVVSGAAWGVTYSDLVFGTAGDDFSIYVFADNTVAIDVSAGAQPYFSGYLVST